jgi:hypothetical protein
MRKLFLTVFLGHNKLFLMVKNGVFLAHNKEVSDNVKWGVLCHNKGIFSDVNGVFFGYNKNLSDSVKWSVLRP